MDASFEPQPTSYCPKCKTTDKVSWPDRLRKYECSGCGTHWEGFLTKKDVIQSETFATALLNVLSLLEIKGANSLNSSAFTKASQDYNLALTEFILKYGGER